MHTLDRLATCSHALGVPHALKRVEPVSAAGLSGLDAPHHVSGLLPEVGIRRSHALGGPSGLAPRVLLTPKTCPMCTGAPLKVLLALMGRHCLRLQTT